MRLLLAGFALCAASYAPAQTFAGSAALDAATAQAIRDGLIPGAVIIIGHDGKIVHRKAYGARALVPARETATLDTIYDVASLTKVVATTPAIMKLYEQGKIKIDDPVTKYLPEFQGGKSNITIRNLLTHYSGLRPDLDIDPPWSGYETGIRKALIDKPAGPPGVSFVYSDINFELLGEVVRRVSGMPLDQFAREQIFEPLGMRDTMFKPPASLVARIAPTEVDISTGKPWRGVVHDPTARYMGGVAGHAGVFSTADDLARYAQMMLAWVTGCASFAPATDRAVHLSRLAARSSDPARLGLGYRLAVLFQSRRSFPARDILRTYGFYGTIDMDRPGQQIVRRDHDQPRPSQGRAQHQRMAQEYRDHRRERPGPRPEERSGDDGTRRARASKFRSVPRPSGGTDHQPDRNRSPGPPQRGFDARGGREDRRALYSGAWNHGPGRPPGYRRRARSGHGASHPQPVQQRPLPADSGDAARGRHAGVRYPGCRRALLYLFLHHAVRAGRSREGQASVLCARPAQSGHRAARRRSDAGRESSELRGLLRSAGSSRTHAGRARHHGQR